MSSGTPEGAYLRMQFVLWSFLNGCLVLKKLLSSTILSAVSHMCARRTACSVNMLYARPGKKVASW